jgi:hypothetical protein
MKIKLITAKKTRLTRIENFNKSFISFVVTFPFIIILPTFI